VAGAEGIGLLRTEFMFMGRPTPPSVEAQSDAYTAALEPFGGRPAVIRTLDVGGDKQLPYLRQAPETNPFLGIRAIRLAEQNRGLLVDQLRAILATATRTRAETWLMAPMVADLADVALFRDLIAEATVGATGQVPGVKVGMMIEVPAAVALADQLAAAVDFVSVGTNDLAQYLLAADRTNPALAARQDPMHPALLRSVRTVIQAAHAAHIPVAVCGEMAGDPVGAVTLAGLGIDELSMEPASFGAVKRALRSIRFADAQRIAAEACDTDSAAEARGIVRKVVSDGAADG
jgi:phosphocarrier protein FPr